MDIEKAIKLRQSIRSYSDKDIEEEKLMKVMEAARLAPSAANRQEWRFIAVKSSGTRKELSRAAKGQQMVKEAPVVIVCCAVTDGHIMSCGQKCYPIDVAIAIDHMTLQAVELGLGTCWVGAFKADAAKAILDIPKDIEVVEMLAIGYPRQKLEVKDKPRLSMDEILYKESWPEK